MVPLGRHSASKLTANATPLPTARRHRPPIHPDPARRAPYSNRGETELIGPWPADITQGDEQTERPAGHRSALQRMISKISPRPPEAPHATFRDRSSDLQI